MKKPVVGFIAGITTPAGHAGALIWGGADTAEAKLDIMDACGIKVTKSPS
jgi:succinyl-CoA synthetase alpha subunit